MREPTFRELFALRSSPGAEIVDRFATSTRVRFNHESGIPLVVCAPDDSDLPFLLTALGRSSISLAPIVVDNAPGRGGATEIARRMGAQVVEEPIAGHMSALQSGLKKALADYPDAPVLITDDDCLPQKHWADVMVNRSGLRRNEGGIAYGGVIIEHGSSFAADALRTVYAHGADIRRRLSHTTPKARGPNGILQLDMHGNIMAEVMSQSPDVFPCDVVVRDSVIAAGGEAVLLNDPYAVMFTRGDRFGSVADLARDFIERGEHRIELYRTDEVG